MQSFPRQFFKWGETLPQEIEVVLLRLALRRAATGRSTFSDDDDGIFLHINWWDIFPTIVTSDDSCPT